MDRPAVRKRRPTAMSEREAFDRILASLHAVALDRAITGRPPPR